MEKIAVVGLSCLFPGAQTPEQFWQNLIAQKDVISQLTKEQVGVDPEIFYDPEKGTPDRYYCLRSGFIRDFQFDPSGYRVPADFVAGLDDIFKWSLYVAKQALADSGYLNRADVLAKCGVILGNLSSPTRLSQRLVTPIYHKTVESALRELLDQEDLQLPSLMPERVSPFNLFTAGYPSTLIPQALGLAGTSFSLDAACASPLYAVQLACEYLISRKADLMLAGAVSCSDPFVTHIGFSLYRAYPSDGVGRPLDQNSGGMITGEGAGMLALKRYSDAVRDGDKIYATILGVGLSNDGKGKHFLTPSSKGQMLAFERAYADANIDPQSIKYVECHATGTDLGDKTELSSMDAFFGRYGGKPKIGSVKSNLGHLLTAAGMPSMIKVILSMANEVIPPTINVQAPLFSPNGVIGPDQVVTSLTPWPSPEPIKRAAVSAFGFGGTNAHLVIEQGAAEPEPEQAAVPQLEPVAIVGMDAFFGQCNSLDAFDRSIYEGKQHFIPVPLERWHGIEKHQALLQEYGFADGQAPLGAYIENFDIDFLRFKIQPNLYEQPIPQQLLILKVADEALQNAGMKEGGNVAVLIAMETEGNAHLYRARCDSLWQVPTALEQANLKLPPELEADLKEIVREGISWPAQVNRYISYVGNIMASRISAAWDFTGPSLTISAGENSTFKALEIAQILLADHKVDAVVVGAVDLAGGVENVLLRHQINGINEGEPTPGFDVNTNGWLVGEGAGAIVLKRLDHAQQNGDRIYATVDAISLVQEQAAADCAPVSPSAATIAQACEQAFAQANITPAQVGYLEVYGSGVPQEDAAEIAGLTQAYRQSGSDLGDGADRSCGIGTVKANIGHTFAASGIASLIKAALCVYHRYIPAVPQWSEPKHPELWTGTPFYVATESQIWPLKTASDKRIAAVNSLGLDGSCAHVILSENSAQTSRPSRFLEQTPFYLFPVTGNSQDQLLEALQQLQQQIEASTDLAKTASEIFAGFKQSSSQYVATILGGTKTEVLQEIQRGFKGIGRAFQQGKDWQTPAGSYFTPHPQGKEGSVAFVYPGAFMSYLGMGRDAARLFPKLYDILPDESAKLADLLYAQCRLLYPRSLSKLTARQWEALEAEFANDSVGMLVAGTVAAIQASVILKDYFQLEPQSAFGYSLGELTMLFSLGVWSNVESIATNLSSSELFRTRLAGPKTAIQEFWGLPIQPDSAGDFWSTYVLLTSVEDVRAAVQQESRVYITHVNTPQEVVIGGDKQACLRLVESLKCDYFPLPISGILHCDPVHLEFEQLKQWATLPVHEHTAINFYSAASYNKPDQLSTDKVANLVATALSQCCDFPRLINKAYEDGSRIFVELGPGGSCSRWIKETLRDQKHIAFTISNRGVDTHTSVVRALAKLVSHQVPVNLSPLYTPIEASRQTAKSLIRTVMIPGALRIRETILSDANRQKFAGQCVRVAPAAVASVQPDTPASVVAVETWVQPMPASVTQIQPPLRLASDQRPAASSNGKSANPAFHSAQFHMSSDQNHSPTASSSSASSSSASSSSASNPPASSSSASNPSASNPPASSSSVIRVDSRLSSFTAFNASIQKLNQHQKRLLNTTVAFLQARQEGLRQLSELIQYQMILSRQALNAAPATAGDSAQSANVVFNEAEVLEVACGKLSNVFGKEYESIDLLPRCTRVPMPPYLFISRVTQIEAKRGQLEDCFIETEYDIPFGAWYSSSGYMPCAVAIEASHSNIFLMSYIGIDFQTQGGRVYRALGGTITFMNSLPQEGQTMRCEVTAHDFSRMGETILFTFTYKAFVGDRQFMQMECKAGFFSDEELLKGQGIPESKLDKLMRSKVQKQHFEPLLRCQKTAFSQADLQQFNQGNFAACFGEGYGRNPQEAGYNFFSPSMIQMLDRITSVDVKGGAWGLGLLTAEKDLTPDAWYFNCHFKDDFCIPGTLVGEGCGQLLAFYLLYLGLHTRIKDAITQPLLNQNQIGHYRGQITPTTGTITYRVEVTEIGLTPRPYIKAECSAIFNGKTIAVMKNLGLELVPRPTESGLNSDQHHSPSNLLSLVGNDK